MTRAKKIRLALGVAGPVVAIAVDLKKELTAVGFFDDDG